MTRIYAPPGLLCEACGRPLAFKELPSGKWCPCDPGGAPHWDACKAIQRKQMGLLNEDGTVNWDRLHALKPPLVSNRAEAITHVWAGGDVPPWDDSLGHYRNFTAAEKAAGILCIPIER